MKKNELAFVWRAAAFGLALLSMAVPTTRTAAQGLPLCSWPFEVTGRGITNVATPDTNATYWVMPVDTNRWSLVIIDGEYPAARFFNFSSYQATGALVDSIEDASIPPNSGVNPFAIKIEDHPFGSYEIQASRSAGGSGTSLRLGGSRLQFIVYRVYAPDMGVDRAGGVGVPRVTLVAPNGTSRTLQPCPFADAETSLTGLILLLRANGFTDAANFLQRVLMAADQLRFGRDSCAGQPTPTTVNFDIATLGADFFPNPQTTYLETPGLCLPTGKVLVVKGRAPIFPSTYNGGSIFDPAPPFDPGSEIQLRYWSMCNNNRVIPFPSSLARLTLRR